MHILICKHCGAGLSRPVARTLCDDPESTILSAEDWPVVLAYEFECERKPPRGYIYAPSARRVTAFWMHPDAILLDTVLGDTALEALAIDEYCDAPLHCRCGARFGAIESIFDAVAHVEVHEPDIHWKLLEEE